MQNLLMLLIVTVSLKVQKQDKTGVPVQENVPWFLCSKRSMIDDEDERVASCWFPPGLCLFCTEEYWVLVNKETGEPLDLGFPFGSPWGASMCGSTVVRKMCFLEDF